MWTCTGCLHTVLINKTDFGPHVAARTLNRLQTWSLNFPVWTWEDIPSLEIPGATNEHTETPHRGQLEERHPSVAANRRAGRLSCGETLALQWHFKFFSSLPHSMSICLPPSFPSPFNPPKSQLMPLLLAQTGREQRDKQNERESL